METKNKNKIVLDCFINLSTPYSSCVCWIVDVERCSFPSDVIYTLLLLSENVNEKATAHSPDLTMNLELR